MVMVLPSSLAAIVSTILSIIGAECSPANEHMATCVLRGCLNHKDERDLAFLCGRMQILMALVGVDKDGFNAHDLIDACKLIQEAQAAHYTLAQIERDNRRAQLRARIANVPNDSEISSAVNGRLPHGG